MTSPNVHETSSGSGHPLASGWRAAVGANFQTATTPIDRLRALGESPLDTMLLGWPNANPYAFGWDGRDRYDYREYDLRIDQVLEYRPQMRFILCFGSLHGTPYYWGYDHTDELAVYHLGERMQQASLGSMRWREDSSRAAERFAEHYATGPHRDRVLGFMPYSTGVNWRGVGEDRPNIPAHEVPQTVHDPIEGDFSRPMREAFRAYLAERYDTDAALQRAWATTDVTRETAELPSRIEVRSPTPAVRDYFACYNRLNAELALAWCDALKRGAPDKQVVLPHGYVFGWPNENLSAQGSGHATPELLLASEAVDALYSSPSRPMEHRCPLSQHALGSLALHGKRHACALELLNGSTIDADDQRAEMSLGVGYAICKGSDLVVTEPREGRGSMRDNLEQTVRLPYDRPALREHLSTLVELHARAGSDPSDTGAEMAVFIDPRGCLHRAFETRFGERRIEAFRNEVLNRVGCPFDEYHLDDFASVAERYKLWVFIDTPTFAPEDWERIERDAGRSLFATAARDAPTIAEVREAAASAGVHLFADAGDTFYASPRFAAYAAHASGDKSLAFPRPVRVRDALSDAVLIDGETGLRFSANAGEVRLWHLEAPTGSPDPPASSL
jgi:hypothetical protein